MNKNTTILKLNIVSIVLIYALMLILAFFLSKPIFHICGIITSLSILYYGIIISISRNKLEQANETIQRE